MINLPLDLEIEENVGRHLLTGLESAVINVAIWIISHVLIRLTEKYPNILSEEALGLLGFAAATALVLSYTIALISFTLAIGAYVNSRGEKG